MALLANVLVCIGILLAFLDFVLRRTPDQTRVWLLHAGVILIGLGVLLGAPGLVDSV